MGVRGVWPCAIFQARDVSTTHECREILNRKCGVREAQAHEAAAPAASGERGRERRPARAAARARRTRYNGQERDRPSDFRQRDTAVASQCSAPALSRAHAREVHIKSTFYII